MSPNLFFQIFSGSYFLFLVIWLRLVQFRPKIGKKNKNIEPGAENKHSLEKEEKKLKECVQISDLCFEFVFAFNRTVSMS